MNDAISRKEAIDGFYEIASDVDHLCTVGDYISFLESLSAQPDHIAADERNYLLSQPERKKGHWILHYDEIMLSDGTSISGVECSKCGWKKYDKIYRLIACPYNFCPNCGAYMKEEQDE